ncbi:MAG: bifunctional phosphopantothenoylcysteine decarboxylase/phosphopantothenate--cysteine ligase CoaBC [Chloroflexi bacterium]|nr:bifunctional phosphopantothenoylcysteine decarboxylase/phosphopantothenate--cysteine ligase CoaBC [Chloroflexota bacterium]
MKSALEGKRVVLGVTGSIACYKAVDLASKLVQVGASVDVIMTGAAAQFVTPLTFRSITHRPVVTDLFDPDSELSVEHVALAERADIVAIVPATAHTIAKLAHGLADDALTTTVLATAAPVLVAPAMDAHMYENAIVQANLEALKRRGIAIVGPERGRLASGLWGWGRLAEPATVVGHIAATLGRHGDLAGRTIVVSAGGTMEPIDPVRVITNRSSGKMGYAIAEAARDRGARIILVTTPTANALPVPACVEATVVESVAQMRDAVLSACAEADVLIMAAAVSDYRVAQIADQKIKKSDEGGASGLTLHLVENADFFPEVPESVMKVGFAAESQDILSNARKKIFSKGLEFIVANDITMEGAGFGVDTNKVTILDKEGGVLDLPLMTKYEVAHHILGKVAGALKRRT